MGAKACLHPTPPSGCPEGKQKEQAGHPHPGDKALLGSEQSSQAWLQDPAGQIFVKCMGIGEGSKPFPSVMKILGVFQLSGSKHTYVIVKKFLQPGGGGALGSVHVKAGLPQPPLPFHPTTDSRVAANSDLK